MSCFRYIRFRNFVPNLSRNILPYTKPGNKPGYSVNVPKK